MALTIRLYSNGGERLVSEVTVEAQDDAILEVTEHSTSPVDTRDILDELHLHYRARDCE